MAELGNLLGGEDAEKKEEVNVEMLDYSYVNSCTDVKKLRAIVEKLASGSEGLYPDLQRTAEDRLMSLLPVSEQKKIMRLKHKTTPHEINMAESELNKWQESVIQKDSLLRKDAKNSASECSKGAKEVDSAIFSSAETAGGKSYSSASHLPPVRGSKPSSSSVVQQRVEIKSGSADSKISEAKDDKVSSERLSGYDFRAWEKFDVDSAVDAVDKNDLNFGMGASQSALATAAAAKRAAAHQKEMEQLQREIGASHLSPMQISARANREKTKGNECFRVGENEEAYACYSRSLALDPNNAVTYANRATACNRLKRYELAEDDCTRALKLDHNYIKAWTRRGMVRFTRGKYKEAADDFEEALMRDPENNKLVDLASNARKKFFEVEGRELPDKNTVNNEGSRTLPLSKVASVGLLPLPKAGALQVASGRYSRVIKLSKDVEVGSSSSTFTRIAISEEEDEEEDEGEENEAEKGSDEKQGKEKANSIDDVLPAKSGFTRVPIIEEDDSDEDEHVAQDQQEDTLSSEEKEQLATRLKDEGNSMLHAKNYEQAIECYSKSLVLLPSQSASLNNRAYAYLLTKKYDKACEDASAVLEKEPNNQKALYRRAASLHELGHNEQASSDLARLLAHEGGNVLALQLKEKIEKRKFSVSSSSISSDAEFEMEVETLRQRALQKLGDGNGVEAAAILEQALLLPSLLSGAEPSESKTELVVTLLHLLVSAHFSSENYVQALEAASKILVRQPKNFKALLKRAEAAHKLGRLETAKGDIRLVLQIEPSLVEAQVLQASMTEDEVAKSLLLKDKGNEAMNAKKFAEAVALYTESIDCNPNNSVSLNNRAQAYLKLSQFAEAERDATRAMNMNESDKSSTNYHKALFRRALSRRGMGGAHVELAVEDLRALVELDQGNKTNQAELDKTLILQKEIKANASKKPISSSSSFPSPPPTSTRPALTSPSLEMKEHSTTKRTPASSPQDSLSPVAAMAASLPLTPPSVPSQEKVGGGSDSGLKKAAARAASASAAVKSSVPSEPPKTMYELERQWRALKSKPELFASYIKLFKKSTYKKVIKEAISQEILSSIVIALRDHCEKDEILVALGGIAQSNSFDMTLALLPEDDATNLRAVFAKLDSSVAETIELRGKFRM